MSEFAVRRLVMVDTQVRPADVTKFPIIEAMLAVPREAYLPGAWREAAYMDGNLELSPGRVVTEPRTLAKLLDVLDVQPNELVLDLGCTLGYSTAVLARLAEAVVGVEEDAAMAAEAQRILSAQGVDNAAVVQAPLTAGAPKHGPYDVMIVQGGVQVLPEALLSQLREGGRIGCVFMEGALGVARIGTRLERRMTWRYAFNAAAPVLPGFAEAPAFVL